METELETQVQEKTRSLRPAEAMVAAVGTGEGRYSPGGFIWIMWRSNKRGQKNPVPGQMCSRKMFVFVSSGKDGSL